MTGKSQSALRDSASPMESPSSYPVVIFFLPIVNITGPVLRSESFFGILGGSGSYEPDSIVLEEQLAN